MRDCSASTWSESQASIPPPPPERRSRPPPPPPLGAHFHDKRLNLPEAFSAAEASTSGRGTDCRCPCEYMRVSEYDVQLVASMRMTTLARELWTELLLEVKRQRIKEEIAQQFSKSPAAFVDDDDQSLTPRCLFCSQRRQQRQHINNLTTISSPQGAGKSTRRFPSFRPPSPSTTDSEPKRVCPQWDGTSGLVSAVVDTNTVDEQFLPDPLLTSSCQSILWMLDCPDYTL